MEEIFSLNNNLLINNDVSLNGNLTVTGTITGGATTLGSLTTTGTITGWVTTVDSLATDTITAQGTTTTINVDKKLNVTDTLIVDAEFRCENGDGTVTHFNNGNGSKNYIRGSITYCDTDFRMDTTKYIQFGNLQEWFLQSGVIWFNLLYAYTNNNSQQIQNELNFRFN